MVEEAEQELSETERQAIQKTVPFKRRKGQVRDKEVIIEDEDERLIFVIRQMNYKQQMNMAIALSDVPIEDFMNPGKSAQLTEDQTRRMFQAQRRVLIENLVKTPDNEQIDGDYIDNLSLKVVEKLMEFIMPDTGELRKK